MHNRIKRVVACDMIGDSLSESFSAGQWSFGSTLHSCIVLRPWRDHIHVATTSLLRNGIMEAGIRGSPTKIYESLCSQQSFCVAEFPCITSPYAAFFGKPLT